VDARGDVSTRCHISACAQISRAILDEQQRFKPPKWLEEAKQPVTKEELEQKIDQLHAAINDVASQTGSDAATVHK
jgi:fructose/tagatose bisphosphate aldolase